MPKAKIPSWIEQTYAKIKEQQAEESQYFKFPEGETEILVDNTQPPVEISKAFNKKDDARIRYQYKIIVKGQVKTLEVGTPLHRLIIKALMQDLNPMMVVRAGTDIKTRYCIKVLMK